MFACPPACPLGCVIGAGWVVGGTTSTPTPRRMSTPSGVSVLWLVYHRSVSGAAACPDTRAWWLHLPLHLPTSARHALSHLPGAACSSPSSLACQSWTALWWVAAPVVCCPAGVVRSSAPVARASGARQSTTPLNTSGWRCCLPLSAGLHRGDVHCNGEHPQCACLVLGYLHCKECVPAQCQPPARRLHIIYQTL